MKRVVVLGGGIGGLASAAILSRKGFEVTILEQKQWWGGKSRRLYLDEQNYLDSGPSILSLPTVLRRFEELCNELDPSSKVESIKLRSYENLGYYFHENYQIELPCTKGSSYSSAWKHYSDSQLDLYESILPLMYTDPHSKKAFGPGLKMMKKFALKPTVDRYLSSMKYLPEPLKEVIGIHALHAGSSPRSASALYACLPAIISKADCWVPCGGMYSLIEHLVKMNELSGSRMLLDTQVTGITSDAIETSKGEFQADFVVSNMCFYRFSDLQRKLKKKAPARLSCSALAIYASLKEDVDLDEKYFDQHLVVMPKDYQAFFKQLDTGWRLDSSMSFVSFHRKNSKIYPTNTKPTMSLVITQPAQSQKLSLDDDLVKSELRRLESILGLKKSLYALIDKYELLDPSYYNELSGLGGALYGAQKPWWQSGPFHDVSYQDKNGFWHVGASVHPGGGIPAVIGGTMIGMEKFLASHGL